MCQNPTAVFVPGGHGLALETNLCTGNQGNCSPREVLWEWGLEGGHGLLVGER